MQGAEKSITLKETWWVQPEGMRVDVTGLDKELKDLYLRFIYQNDKKIFKSENGKIENQPISYRHLERPFHLRSAKKLRKLFALWGVAPFKVSEREKGQGADSFSRLSRKGGVVQYEFSQGKATLWIEQDEFVIRGWQWKGGESLMAWDYQSYPQLMFLPSKRLFIYNSNRSWIQVTKVESLKANARWFRKTMLTKKNHISQNLSSADQERVREFYKHFR